MCQALRIQSWSGMQAFISLLQFHTTSQSKCIERKEAGVRANPGEVLQTCSNGTPSGQTTLHPHPDPFSDLLLLHIRMGNQVGDAQIIRGNLQRGGDCGGPELRCHFSDTAAV